MPLHLNAGYRPFGFAVQPHQECGGNFSGGKPRYFLHHGGAALGQRRHLRFLKITMQSDAARLFRADVVTPVTLAAAVFSARRAKAALDAN
ncbi:hypothetical protein BayCH28_01555 [Mycolicibacterium sp. CH28]|uniref:hypothetical protein n=1 Tax=Mycolicibacterium sp. CH28 TaxID=2512237 RepID=UPI001081F3BC|nr:hypothetical protein [Mycolicibacterium sp. CH28]TGD90574.1 hypothetical protein BayCH28_01555 [Mycolicibacterium sp. CH28]